MQPLQNSSFEPEEIADAKDVGCSLGFRSWCDILSRVAVLVPLPSSQSACRPLVIVIAAIWSSGWASRTHGIEIRHHWKALIKSNI